MISCGIDLQTNTVWYGKNGKSLGQAFTIDSAAAVRGLFPHVLLKNVQIEVTFDSLFSHSLDDDFVKFLPIQCAVNLGVTTPEILPPTSPEILMLVGLPKVGKTKWTQDHIKENPEKLYYVLSTNNIMNR